MSKTTTTTAASTTANRVKETIVTAAKDTAKARLAEQAKHVADKAIEQANKTSDPNRANRAWAKVEEAKATANLRAKEAGLKQPFPASRARKQAAATARGEAASARSRKVEATKAAEPKVQPKAEPAKRAVPAPAPVDKRKAPRLTKFGAMLLGLIGSGSTSFFDDGIVENSGIWHECLTGETAGTEGMPTTGKGVANVIDRLCDLGLLDKGSPDEDGQVWVWLTKRGAVEARRQAKVLFNFNNADGKQTVATKPAAKKATATKAKVEPKAAKSTDPLQAAKIVALLEFAEAHGWFAATTQIDEAGTGVTITLQHAERVETFTVAFFNGSMDASKMPFMTRSNGSTVLLRNVSAVKANLMTAEEAAAAGKSSLRVKAAVERAPRKSRTVSGAEEPARNSVPFDIARAEDDEVLDLLAGRTVTWRRRLDNGEETAVIGRKVWMPKANKEGKERIVHFIERVEGKRLHEGGQRSFRLDQIVNVK